MQRVRLTASQFDQSQTFVVFSRKSLKAHIPSLPLTSGGGTAATAAQRTGKGKAEESLQEQGDRWWVRASGMRTVNSGNIETTLNVRRVRTVWKDTEGIVFIPANDYDDAKRLATECTKHWTACHAHAVSQDSMQSEGDLRGTSGKPYTVTVAYPPLCLLLPDSATVTQRLEDIFDYVESMRTSSE